MTIQDWLGTLFAILITPFPRTYLREARKAPGKFSSAVAWLAFLAAATGVDAASCRASSVC
jgi:hypothetical protein